MKNINDKSNLLNNIKYIGEKQYWINKLDGDIDETKFFTQRIKMKEEEQRDVIKLDFPKSLSGEIIKISKNSDVSIYIILMTILKVLVYKYIGNNDIAIISPIYKPNRTEETLNNYSIIRDKFKRDKSFKDLMLQVRQTTLESFENQDYPFEKITQTVFNSTEKYYESSISKIICVQKNIHDDSFIEKLADNILISFEKKDGQIQGELHYNGLIYDQKYVEQIGRHYIYLGQQAISNLGEQISKLSPLSPEETTYILHELNQTASDYSLTTPIPSLITQMAAKKGDAPVIVFKEEVMTYKELNGKANDLAFELAKIGITQSSYVPVLMERSFELPLAEYAIMKLGATFVPLGVDWPAKRIDEIAENLGTNTILVNQGIDYDVQQLIGYEIIEVDVTTLQIRDVEPAVIIELEDPMFVIFTSGSSGKPKGAVNIHKGILNRFLYMNKRYQPTENDVIMLTSNHVFDSSVWQLFWPLINGLKTIIPQPSKSFDIDLIIDLVKEHQVTITDFVPSVFNLIVDLIEDNPDIAEKLITLRQLLIGGEAMTSYHIYKFKSYLPNVSITNTYGPSETSIGTVFYELPENYIDIIPIGRPIDNVLTLILDENFQPVPLGAPGELYLGGVCVGLGYVNDLEKTNQVFFKPPINSYDQGVYYKTGDKARYRFNGDIEFLGRVDSQVKIRGIRIELDEIKAKLLLHSNIKDVAVILEEKQGEKYLFAFLVIKDKSEEMNMVEIRNFLVTMLPEYMIPLQFIILDNFPLTSNGKLDKKALRSYLDLHNEVKEVDAPRNEKEKVLLEVWHETLSEDNIGINDNFFMIGGDSIKTIQVISRIRKKGYIAEVSDIFQNPTIASLAGCLKEFNNTSNQQPITGEITLTAIQKEFFVNATIDIHHFNQSVMLFSEERLDKDGLEQVFKKIQEHHDALRINYKITYNQIIQMNNGIDYPLDFLAFDLRNNQNAKTIFKVQTEEIQSGIDLEKGPLMKVALFNLDDGDRLLVVIHHLVVDGVSWRILFEDINTLYTQYKKGEQLTLPMKSHSFKFWSEKINNYANSEKLFLEKPYWKEIESKTISRIERDFADGNGALKFAQTTSITLSEDETNSLLTEVNKTYNVNTNDILLTVLALATKKTFGKSDILVLLEGHGRENIIEGVDITRTIGWFTSVYPVVLSVANETNLSYQIKITKETIRKIPNKGVGYGVLKYLTAEENKQDLTFSLKPQIVFNYLGQIDEDISKLSMRIADESSGLEISQESLMRYDFNITGIVINKQLKIDVIYCEKFYARITIEKFINNYEEILRQIISHCLNQEEQVVTPSDLGFKDLSIEELENFFN